jgi:hypothetical protein
MCDVESHRFDLDTMLFMDWRDDHTAGNADMQESNEVNQHQPIASESLPQCRSTIREHILKAFKCRCMHLHGRLRTIS